MYEIIICPLKKLYRLCQDGDMSEVAVIGVSSYDIPEEKLEGFWDTLCMRFDDITDRNDYKAFNPSAAERIAAYVRDLPGTLDTLFVCCDSGESRSSAMAAAIMRYKGLNELRVWKNPHYHPNPLVYKLLCCALGCAVSDAEVEEKVAANKRAFSEAMRR